MPAGPHPLMPQFVEAIETRARPSSGLSEEPAPIAPAPKVRRAGGEESAKEEGGDRMRGRRLRILRIQLSPGG